MDLRKLEDADKVTRAAAKEAGAKVTDAKRRLKAARKGARGAKAELRKARKLLREVKAEARKAEKQARKSGRKLSKALRETKRKSVDVKKVGHQASKVTSRILGDRMHVSSGATNSADIRSPVTIDSGVRLP